MTSDPPQDGLPPGRRGLAMTCVALGISITVLDSAMVNVALPGIAREMAVTPATVTWVVNAYQLALVSLLLPFASLGEVLGFKLVYRFGLCVFIAGAFGSASAGSLEVLLASRVMQGVGSAAVMSVSAALIRHTYPMSMLGRAIGVNALTVALGSATAPSIGSVIISLAGWPFIFYATLPIGLGVLLVGSRFLPDVAPQRRPFDWPGAALNVSSFSLLFLGLDMLLVLPWLAVALLLAAGLSFWVLVRLQRRQPAPLLPLDLLRIVPVRLAIIASACMFGAQAMVYIGLPFHLTAAGRSVAEIGLMVSPWPAAIALAAPISGRLSDRVNAAWLCALGSAAVAAGLLVVALLPADGPMWPIMAALAFCGLGFGAFQAPNNRTMLANAPRSRAGSAGGMQSTARVLGQAAGTVIVATVFHVSAHGSGGGSADGLGESIALGALFAAAVVAGVAAVVNLMRQRMG